MQNQLCQHYSATMDANFLVNNSSNSLLNNYQDKVTSKLVSILTKDDSKLDNPEPNK